VNRRCPETVWYSKQELQDLTFSDITLPDDFDAAWALVHALLRGERSTCSVDTRAAQRPPQIG